MTQPPVVPFEQPSGVNALIVCALDVEFDALEDQLASGICFRESSADYRELKHFFTKVGDLVVLIAQLPPPGAGNVTSAALTASLLPLLNPTIVVSFGIAGTLKEQDVPSLSTVYSETVYYIDLRKDAADGGESVKQVPSISTRLELRQELDKLSGPGVHKVVVASSEAVVKAETSRRREIASRFVADASVVEMESYGVLKACEVEGALFDTKRLYVAVKGITDHADLTKSDELHQPAAKAAAGFLGRVLSEPRIVALVLRSRAHTRSAPFRRFRTVDLVDERIETFTSIVAPVVSEVPSQKSLIAPHLRCEKPRVFYHWRLTGMGLHFVDYRFVSVLRDLAAQGYPVECLVTDTPNQLSFSRLLGPPEYLKALEVVERAMAGMFGDLPYTFTRYSDLRSRQRLLNAFSEPSGGQQALLDALIQAGQGRVPELALPALSMEFNLWFRYMAWRCRHEGTGIVLINPLSVDTYAQLWRFGDFVPALVPTSGFVLANKTAKTQPPGCELFLDPPEHGAILEWLQKTDSPAILREFHEHLTLFPVTDDILESRRKWAAANPQLIRGCETWRDAFIQGTDDPVNQHRGAVAAELARCTKLMTGTGSARELG